MSDVKREDEGDEKNSEVWRALSHLRWGREVPQKLFLSFENQKSKIKTRTPIDVAGRLTLK